MEKIKTVTVELDPPVLLDDDGYGELIGQIQEAVADGDDEVKYTAVRLIVELVPVKEIDKAAIGKKDEDEPAEGAAD